MRLGDKAEASQYGHRGQKHRDEARKICIEGEYVLIEDIATRIARSKNTAIRRLVRERAKTGPVTWAGLGEP